MEEFCNAIVLHILGQLSVANIGWCRDWYDGHTARKASLAVVNWPAFFRGQRVPFSVALFRQGHTEIQHPTRTFCLVIVFLRKREIFLKANARSVSLRNGEAAKAALPSTQEILTMITTTKESLATPLALVSGAADTRGIVPMLGTVLLQGD